MDFNQIVKKLIGPIKPVGETHVDDARFENLASTMELVSKLLDEIAEVSSYSERQEFSMSRAGKMAKGFLIETSQEIASLELSE